MRVPRMTSGSYSRLALSSLRLECRRIFFLRMCLAVLTLYLLVLYWYMYHSCCCYVKKSKDVQCIFIHATQEPLSHKKKLWLRNVVYE